MHYPTLCLCSPQTGSSSFRNYFDSLSWNALSKVQSVVTCIFYCWCEVICPGIEFTAVIWTQVFSKPQGDTQSWSGTEWLQENKTELSRYPVWGIKMPLLVTVCLLPGGINKGTFFFRANCWAGFAFMRSAKAYTLSNQVFSHFTMDKGSLENSSCEIHSTSIFVFILKRNLWLFEAAKRKRETANSCMYFYSGPYLFIFNA